MLKIIFTITSLCTQIMEKAKRPQKNQSAEMQQEIDDLKKEIKDLETEIKLLQQSDPEETAELKKELAEIKSMLFIMGDITTTVKIPAKPFLNNGETIKQAQSPYVPTTIKQPVTIPTTEQAKDKLLWFSGKKLNDNTLVTVKGLLVQYSVKKSMVIVQLPKKTDRFEKTVNELINDTALMTGFVGYEETSQQFKAAMYQINRSYKADILIYANFVFYAGEIDEERTIDLGNEILQKIAGFKNQAPAAAAMGKLKQRYKRKNQMDINSQEMIKELSNDRTAFLV